MATTPLNFFTGPESNINSLAKKQGQVIFAINGDETTGNIYQDISNTKRIKIGKNAETAQKDANGNVITDTYETKSDASAKLAEAKAYTDTEVAKKANSTHTHSISNIDNLQETLDGHDIAIDELNEEVSIDYSQIAFDTGSEYADSGIDFSVYQTKADGTLTTTAKTVSGAINELDAGIDNEASLRTAADTALDAKISQISNPNLLINSDFRNPINQRGATTYSGSGNPYSIDRWRTLSSNVEIIEGGLRIYNTISTRSYFAQFFEKPYKGTYTLTLNVLTLDGTCVIYGDGFNEQQLVEGINVYHVTTNSNYNLINIVLGLHSGSSIVIEYIKLEQGSIATPFVPRSYGEELALCQRYYWKRPQKLEAVAGYMNGSGSVIVTLPIPTPMRNTVPTVKISDIARIYVLEGPYYRTSSALNDVFYNGGTSITLHLANACTSVVAVGCQIGSTVTIELDAEIY